MAEGAGALVSAIAVERVSHGYGSLDVLDDVTLRAQAGELVAILGPSGCGKSTLLRLLAGLEAPSAGGTVAVGGARVDGPSPERALVFQDPTLFPWRTVRQNVAIGPQALGKLKESSAAIDEAIRLVGLDGFADARPQQLSGGMAQRAALARALVNRPSLLLLDEPLGRLDALTRLSMQRELLRLWQDGGFTALLVTHDVDEALVLADRVVVMSPRPARILADIRVDANRPRAHDDPRLTELRRSILGLLGFDEAVVGGRSATATG
jgi:NitT/TauT family transport system ATP-binding protein